MKILKELKRTIHSNVGYCKKRLETRRRSQEKLENYFAKLKAGIWAMKQNESCKRKKIIQKVE